MSDLTGKVALVTGGSRGIGAAIARRLARQGARVALTYSSSPAAAEAVVSAIQAAGGEALAIQADASSVEDVRRSVAETAAAFGGLDILVNNAGVLALGPVAELPLADFERTYAVNIRAVFVASQAALAHMKEGGRIINIGSCNADRMPFPGGSAYAMSKAALVGLVKGMARDLGPRGITVNNIQPGPVDTDMNPASSEFAQTILGFMALPRYGAADEIAAMAAYLAGPEAGYVTGASLTIDGGFDA